MAIRSAWIRGALVKGGLILFRSWWSRIQVHIDCADPNFDPRVRPAGTILSTWHEDLIAGCVRFASCNLKVLVSHSKDGDYITQTIEGLGFSTIRGSSKRGGAQALREMLRAIDENCLAITVDGPKGPRREVKDGVIYLASRSGAPILAMGYAYSNAHRFRSWDRLAFPWPWSRIVISLMPPLQVPRRADKDELDQYTRELQARMNAANDRAAKLLAEWQHTGKLPQSPAAVQSKKAA